eukprot:GFYU01005153.1.p1 GENE.GFYU01005153.1~~GFYU01005153.1.p1  ORF type:complete len:176 (-),score=49.67 GFYU01005153.1:379-906(-)
MNTDNYNQNGRKGVLIGNWWEEREQDSFTERDPFSTTKDRVIACVSQKEDLSSTQREIFCRPDLVGKRESCYYVDEKKVGKRAQMRQQKLWEEAQKTTKPAGHEPYVNISYIPKEPEELYQGPLTYAEETPVTIWSDKAGRGALVSSASTGANPFSRDAAFSTPIEEYKKSHIKD